eukprot:CAMPEP_0184706504 /NCGR_PEP_ID=MMETSP0313-20130426/36790_1 /TAXON_ID=2792 /ORGANISM="Porphyridium aerugineum, Strain SAG 1380-2" /LENGTH=1516 /DNA_ID=CAMNT_0027168057 /DNA_START=518 /DNA_END=5064 /DNA_ORIENTATION=+
MLTTNLAAKERYDEAVVSIMSDAPFALGESMAGVSPNQQPRPDLQASQPGHAMNNNNSNNKNSSSSSSSGSSQHQGKDGIPQQPATSPQPDTQPQTRTEISTSHHSDDIMHKGKTGQETVTKSQASIEEEPDNHLPTNKSDIRKSEADHSEDSSGNSQSDSLDTGEGEDDDDDDEQSSDNNEEAGEEDSSYTPLDTGEGEDDDDDDDDDEQSSDNNEEDGEEDSSYSSDPNEKTRCPCKSERNIGFMISCEECNTWQHGKCMGIRPNDAPKNYFCHVCRPEEIRVTCIAHPDFKTNKKNGSVLTREKSMDTKQDIPQLRQIRPAELRKLVSSDCKDGSINVDDALQKYTNLMRSEDWRSEYIIDALILVTKLSRAEVSERVDKVLAEARPAAPRTASSSSSRQQNPSLSNTNQKDNEDNTNFKKQANESNLNGNTDNGNNSNPDNEKGSDSRRSSLDKEIEEGPGAKKEEVSGAKKEEGPGEKKEEVSGAKKEEKQFISDPYDPKDPFYVDVYAIDVKSLTREQKKLYRIMMQFHRMDQDRRKRKPRSEGNLASPKSSTKSPIAPKRSPQPPKAASSKSPIGSPLHPNLGKADMDLGTQERDRSDEVDNTRIRAMDRDSSVKNQEEELPDLKNVDTKSCMEEQQSSTPVNVEESQPVPSSTTSRAETKDGEPERERQRGRPGRKPSAETVATRLMKKLSERNAELIPALKHELGEKLLLPLRAMGPSIIGSPLLCKTEDEAQGSQMWEPRAELSKGRGRGRVRVTDASFLRDDEASTGPLRFGVKGWCLRECIPESEKKPRKVITSSTESIGLASNETPISVLDNTSSVQLPSYAVEPLKRKVLREWSMEHGDVSDISIASNRSSDIAEIKVEGFAKYDAPGNLMQESDSAGEEDNSAMDKKRYPSSDDRVVKRSRAGAEGKNDFSELVENVPTAKNRRDNRERAVSSSPSVSKRVHTTNEDVDEAEGFQKRRRLVVMEDDEKEPQASSALSLDRLARNQVEDDTDFEIPKVAVKSSPLLTSLPSTNGGKAASLAITDPGTPVISKPENDDFPQSSPRISTLSFGASLSLVGSPQAPVTPIGRKPGFEPVALSIDVPIGPFHSEPALALSSAITAETNQGVTASANPSGSFRSFLQNSNPLKSPNVGLGVSSSLGNGSVSRSLSNVGSKPLISSPTGSAGMSNALRLSDPSKSDAEMVVTEKASGALVSGGGHSGLNAVCSGNNITAMASGTATTSDTGIALHGFSGNSLSRNASMSQDLRNDPASAVEGKSFSNDRRHMMYDEPQGSPSSARAMYASQNPSSASPIFNRAQVTDASLGSYNNTRGEPFNPLSSSLQRVPSNSGSRPFVNNYSFPHRPKVSGNSYYGGSKLNEGTVYNNRANGSRPYNRDYPSYMQDSRDGGSYHGGSNGAGGSYRGPRTYNQGTSGSWNDHRDRNLSYNKANTNSSNYHQNNHHHGYNHYRPGNSSNISPSSSLPNQGRDDGWTGGEGGSRVNNHYSRDRPSGSSADRRDRNPNW